MAPPPGFQFVAKCAGGTDAACLALAGVEKPEREWKFHATRRWRFDFAWPEHFLAVEVEGATWSGGRHTRGSGFARDAEKYNAAALAKWRVLRFTADMIRKGDALAEIERALGIDKPEVPK